MIFIIDVANAFVLKLLCTLNITTAALLWALMKK